MNHVRIQTESEAETEFEQKPNQRPQEEQFNNNAVRNRTEKAVDVLDEFRKEENPDFRLVNEAMKRLSRSKQDADRQFERTSRDPRVEPDRNVIQEQESAKRKVSSKKEDEQVDDQKQKAEKEKSKKKEDSKKKKKGEPSR